MQKKPRQMYSHSRWVSTSRWWVPNDSSWPPEQDSVSPAQTVMLSLFPPHQGVRLWAEATRPSFSCSLPAKDGDGWSWRRKGQATGLVVLMDCWPGAKPLSQETLAAWFSPRRRGSRVLYQPCCSFPLVFLQPFARHSSHSPSLCDLYPPASAEGRGGGALTEILIQNHEVMGPFEAQSRMKALVEAHLKMAVFTMTAASLAAAQTQLSTKLKLSPDKEAGGL